MKNEITIKDYLNQKGVEFKEANNELITACLFNDCDKDSGTNERHLYFNSETGQYHCKKCGASGNLVTLIKHFGDDIKPAQIKQQVEITKPQNKKLDPSIVENCHNAIPDRIRKYLNDRGITDKIIKKKQLGWGRFYGKNWITIPINDDCETYSFLKLRRDPDDTTNKVKYKVFPAGNHAELYGRECLTNTEKDFDVVICEGEFDCIILEKFGIRAITSTAGAETFKKEWLGAIGHINHIILALDNDEAGKRGSEKIIKLISNNLPHASISQISFPDEMKDGEDVSDYFNHYNGDRSEFMEDFANVIKFVDLSCDPPRKSEFIEASEESSPEEKKKERFIKLKPETSTSIEIWEKTIQENFPELFIPAEVGLSIIGQLLIEDIKNPFALVYVDMPSSGKTIALNFFSTVKELVYSTDNFTTAAFVSHASNRKRKDLEEIDLLPKLRYRTLIIRDMAPIFTKREDDVQEMIGTLIRVLDGEGLETDSGVHGKRGYVGEYLFMMLAASTPIKPKIWKIMGNLGSRLFFLNIDGAEKDEETLANQLRSTCRDKEILCRKVTEEFIKTLWNKHPNGVLWNKENDDLHLLKIIGRLARVLARLRGTINISEESFGQAKYTHVEPRAEMPDRLNQLLYNFTRGHALICGRENIDRDDLKMALRVVLDSIPPNRAKIFKGLIRNGGHLATNEVMEILKLTRPMALKRMKEMDVLEIVDTQGNLEDETEYLGGRPEQKIVLKEKYQWFTSEECRKILNHDSKNSLLTKSDAVLEEYDKQ